MPPVIRKLGKAIGCAALLNIVAVIAFSILGELIKGVVKINKLDETTFIIFFVLTCYFPVLMIIYWMVLVGSLFNKWIENHSKEFQTSLVTGGCGIGLNCTSLTRQQDAGNSYLRLPRPYNLRG
jgi:hypothetical protein